MIRHLVLAAAVAIFLFGWISPSAADVSQNFWPTALDPRQALRVTIAPLQKEFASCDNVAFTITTTNVSDRSLPIDIGSTSVTVIDAASKPVFPTGPEEPVIYMGNLFFLAQGTSYSHIQTLASLAHFRSNDCISGTYRAVVREFIANREVISNTAAFKIAP